MYRLRRYEAWAPSKGKCPKKAAERSESLDPLATCKPP
ncbi:Hypothetical Protein XCAW_03813 [Xanthomonas citri subsp. citri Aw12879]|nr:Hypothetical Protein XCAW_03813 [Xanthomonas citri subsp. citri Aw12879]